MVAMLPELGKGLICLLQRTKEYATIPKEAQSVEEVLDEEVSDDSGFDVDRSQYDSSDASDWVLKPLL